MQDPFGSFNTNSSYSDAVVKQKTADDNLNKAVQNYNNVQNETVGLESKKEAKEAELALLRKDPSKADAARIAQIEIDSYAAQIQSNINKIIDCKKEVQQKKADVANIQQTNGVEAPKTANEMTVGTDSITPTSTSTKEVEAQVASTELSKINSTTGDSQLGNWKEVDKGASAIEVTKVDDKSMFTGVQAGAGDITGERIKYYHANDKTTGFIMPWDGRLNYAYTSTQSIGNYMPYGEEWVGSPAIINPYALIRFDHIAGKSHHKYLIDQRNQNGGFRGTIYKPYANIADYSNAPESGAQGPASPTISQKNTIGETTVSLTSDKRAELGVTQTDGDVYADDSGSLYVNEVDFSQQIWRPKHEPPRKNGVLYKKSEDPSIITIDTPLAGQNAEINRLNETRELRSKSKAQKIANTIKNSDIQQEETDSLKPSSADFWIKRQGWIKCKDASGTELWVEPQHCEGNTIKKTETPENLQQLNDAVPAMKTYVELQIKRVWKNDGNPTKKRYLRAQNSKTVLREPVEPTAENLVNAEHWIGKEQFQYRWADFIFGKYYVLIPNNYMVTLRRYPVPVNDLAAVPDQDKTKQHLLPVATAITWMGNQTGNLVGDLMSFSYRMNWGDLQAEINEVQGNEQGAESSPFGEGVAKWLGILSGQANFNSVSGWDEQRAKWDPYKDGMYANRIYGPVNVITKTKRRERGLEFEHAINLNFHYALKSIGGINPKAAMLDILANILALTYNNAGFWGGANRYFPNKPAYPFLGGKKGMESWYQGNMTGFLDGIADQLTGALKNLGSFVQNLLTNPKEALKGILGKGGQLWMAEKQRDKRPAILALKALLTGDPVGEWHLVIGNPFNPIMMIGNLICTSTKITFSDQLGADDFPDEMIVTITLEHGKPRDKGDIESMFNRGGGRLHYSYFGQDTEYWNQASSTKESNVDCPTCPTTVDDNFTGKKRTMASTSRGNYGGASSNGFDPVKNAFPASVGMSKFYSYTTKQAVQLSEKIGFKSGDSK